MNDHGNERMRKWKTVTAVLNYEEWRELKHLARKNRVLTRDYLRGIIIDALIEERELALQRCGAETRAVSREERTIAGVPTSGDHRVYSFHTRVPCLDARQARLLSCLRLLLCT